ncbi:MAG: class I SAM-dependent methyltransferase [Algibacter sp.]|uniref:class I SAM-dependent methyltransferase n=1 Tax=Algibacter sp. TaxID=1872428 RepID=UPI00261F9CB0|nr:class I SAM-dependent methyltransferase [Algibacter sp.]MDG1731300.1 class I SAM-dependent methyltransferase [Algibacter sp.]MDG2177404.1 class I SAM-dependent methyltransferase [Algibacter sp.]
MKVIKSESISNINKNRNFYDKKYKGVNVSGLIKTLNNLDAFLKDATTTDISWVGMYINNFKDTVKGKKIMELGCGNCANVAVLAALGAEVVANDISDYSGDIVNALNENYKFEHDITFVKGDFTSHDLPEQSLDMVIGKAFLHHLTLAHELEVIKKISQVLKPDGEARFFEPAINSKFLDELRWAVPMNNRPSKLLSPNAFKQWEDLDPHPHRDNSSKHFKRLGHQFFSHIEIVPMGMLERFYRILPFSTKTRRKYRRTTLKSEKFAPKFIQYFGARSQTIIYKMPKSIPHV